jgi:hypothetical protein
MQLFDHPLREHGALVGCQFVLDLVCHPSYCSKKNRITHYSTNCLKRSTASRGWPMGTPRPFVINQQFEVTSNPVALQ